MGKAKVFKLDESPGVYVGTPETDVFLIDRNA